MSNNKIHCKDGLDEFQEFEARQIRKKLLNAKTREDVYTEIRKIFEKYDYSTTFNSYLKKEAPSLYSACVRANLQFRIIDRQLIISME